MTADSSYMDIARLRPKKVKAEKEKLYADAIQFKMQRNSYKEENTRLKTWLWMLEREMDEKEDLISQLFQ